jgi:hypothetical protein
MVMPHLAQNFRKLLVWLRPKGGLTPILPIYPPESAFGAIWRVPCKSVVNEPVNPELSILGPAPLIICELTHRCIGQSHQTPGWLS